MCFKVQLQHFYDANTYGDEMCNEIREHFILLAEPKKATEVFRLSNFYF